MLFYEEKTATNTTTATSKKFSCLIMQKKEIEFSMNHLLACIHEIHLSIQDTATTAAETYLLMKINLCGYFSTSSGVFPYQRSDGLI